MKLMSIVIFTACSFPVLLLLSGYSFNDITATAATALTHRWLVVWFSEFDVLVQRWAELSCDATATTSSTVLLLLPSGYHSNAVVYIYRDNLSRTLPLVILAAAEKVTRRWRCWHFH